MGKLLRSYLFWTYERGSFHYDVMVTLILAFIFVTPHFYNFGDHPQSEKLAKGSVLVKPAGAGNYIFDIPAASVHTDGGPLDAQLAAQIESVSGSVTMDRYQTITEPQGKVTGYRVWAHR
ncbi:hypothetical protein [Silvibacterium dinghuense]|uniref:Uncharacterized protein n=1 Tax=Silvibacterium dinghuense TaxID=1560006 RepID=A0A4Q1SHJ7_9BACT|nr:hypothetical protein [Silvibacterium dinghuense]RXS96859.1 hypothetical protein ESZ00_02635 [Silvibacterium dinghuense]GGG94225.1 hypothetical protein GCM10011586_06340 [Silvibacterium dinghuense]